MASSVTNRATLACKVSDVANLESTYSFTAADVGREVLLSKFSKPSVDVTKRVIVTPVPVSLSEPHSKIALTLKSP